MATEHHKSVCCTEKKREFHRFKTETINTLFAKGFYPFSLAIDKISVKNNRSEILRKNRLSERSEWPENNELHDYIFWFSETRFLSFLIAVGFSRLFSLFFTGLDFWLCPDRREEMPLGCFSSRKSNGSLDKFYTLI